MDLIKQLQGISYSLVFGFLFTFVYSLINRVFYKYHKSIFRYFIQIIVGIVFGYCYYLGLLVINNGVIRGYFIISLLVGFQKRMNAHRPIRLCRMGRSKFKGMDVLRWTPERVVWGGQLAQTLNRNSMMSPSLTT